MLQVGTLRQQIVVSDTGTELAGIAGGRLGDRAGSIGAGCVQQTGSARRASPGTRSRRRPNRRTRWRPLRFSPAAAASDFNKVLIDGIPANDIGGAFEFANLSASGANQVEVFRGANSVLYGADALGSVIQLTTRRGSSAVPEFTYSADGGNFDTLHQEASLGGAFHQFDYFADFMDFQTRNSLPNSSFHNGTFSGNFGWQANQNTDVRFTVRHTATGLGVPNALALYGIPDDAFQREQDTYMGIKVENQTTSQWRNSLQLDFHPSSVQLRRTLRRREYSLRRKLSRRPGRPSAAPMDICSSGQAILDYGGERLSEPLQFPYRRAVALRAYRITTLNRTSARAPAFGTITKVGYTNSAGTLSPTSRNNFELLLGSSRQPWPPGLCHGGSGP